MIKSMTIGAILGAAFTFTMTVWVCWGFDPAAWHPEERLGFALILTMFVVLGANIGWHIQKDKGNE